MWSTLLNGWRANSLAICGLFFWTEMFAKCRLVSVTRWVSARVTFKRFISKFSKAVEVIQSCLMIPAEVLSNFTYSLLMSPLKNPSIPSLMTDDSRSRLASFFVSYPPVEVGNIFLLTLAIQVTIGAHTGRLLEKSL